MAVTVCRIAGFALVAAGLAGFAEPMLLGMHLTPVHNIIHIVSGVLALYFGFIAPGGARGFAIAFGSIYLLLGFAGFAAPNLVAAAIGHDGMVNAGALMPDNVVHIVLGGVFLATGFAAASAPRGLISFQ